jgi:hypothetical protein
VPSRSHSLDGERENDGQGRGPLGAMGNAGARMSRLDVHILNGDLNGEGELQENVSGGGLSAKAGIILVRRFYLVSTTNGILPLELCWIIRASTMSSSSCLN